MPGNRGEAGLQGEPGPKGPSGNPGAQGTRGLPVSNEMGEEGRLEVIEGGDGSSQMHHVTCITLQLSWQPCPCAVYEVMPVSCLVGYNWTSRCTRQTRR